MAMGNWRLHKQKKGARASRTFSKKSRIYRVYPPATGWPGGLPEQNGYRHRA